MIILYIIKLKNINIFFLVLMIDNSNINLNYIKDLAFDDFQKIFATPNKKSLVFEEDLLPYIELLIPKKQLSAWHVVSYHLLNNITSTTNDIVFIIRKNAKAFRMVTSYMESNYKKKAAIAIISDSNYILGKNMLERVDLLTKISIYELPITLIPMDCDLLSMEYMDSFKESMINYNHSYLFDVIESIVLLQQLYGIIPVIQGIGEQSRFVVKEVIAKRDIILDTESKITRMIVIDRTCDFITPLLTQVIYSGALDEQIGIEANKVRIINGKEKVIRLSDDKVYEFIKDKRLDTITIFLRTEMLKYALEYKNAKIAKQNDNFHDLTNAVENIKELNLHYKDTLLIQHYELLQRLTIKEDIIDIEQNLLLGIIKDDETFMTIWISLLKKKYNVMELIKLICLYCIVSNGIDMNYCKQFERYIFEYYGHDYVFLFDNLFTTGILFPKGFDGRWDIIKNKFHLIADDNQDISYIFNGYAPLSCRLVEYALTIPFQNLMKQRHKGVIFNGWTNKKINDKVNLIQDPFYVVQETNLCKNNILLVYFIGGITYAEISALRYLSKMNKDKHIIIATTKIINGNNMLKSLSKL